jgi:hypothetical protein
MPSGEAVTASEKNAGASGASATPSVTSGIYRDTQQKRKSERTAKTGTDEDKNAAPSDGGPSPVQGDEHGSTPGESVPPVFGGTRHPHRNTPRGDEDVVEEGGKRPVRDGDAGSSSAEADRGGESCGTAQGCPRALKRPRDISRSGTVSPAAEGQTQPSPQPQPKLPTKSSSKFRGVSKTVRGENFVSVKNFECVEPQGRR